MLLRKFELECLKLFCVCVMFIKVQSELPDIMTVRERKVNILPTAQPAHSTAASGDSSDTDLGSSKPFTALKDRFLQVFSLTFTFFCNFNVSL